VAPDGVDFSRARGRAAGLDVLSLQYAGAGPVGNDNPHKNTTFFWMCEGTGTWGAEAAMCTTTRPS
jgi:hypothetical protein